MVEVSIETAVSGSADEIARIINLDSMMFGDAYDDVADDDADVREIGALFWVRLANSSETLHSMP